VFGSELKAIRHHPAWNDEVDRNSLSQLLQYGYIAGTRCIYQRVRKVEPGTVVTLRRQSTSSRSYWALKQVVEEGTARPFRGRPAAAVERLDEVLQEIVSEQLDADVPVGALLSGGVDSSMVVSIAQAASSRPLRTFTIRFQEDAFDEGETAKNVSRQLGTDHTELHVTPNDAISLIPRLPHIYDEPLADSSQIPTYFVCQLARGHVTVALSGDGGDESFAGYNRYRRGQRLWQLWLRLPNALRRISSRMLLRNDSAGLRKLGSALGALDSQSFYRAMVSRWPYELDLVRGAGNACNVLPNAEGWADVPDFMPRMQYLDTATYLPDDILAKVDRAGMAVSLESRLPLVDHRCIEFAWTLPAAMKINGRDNKWILRQVLKKRLPQVTIPRAKRGFSVPLATWLRGPLRDWAESLLDRSRLASEGFLHADRIRSLWSQHLRGQQNWHDLLWGVLMYQGWHEEQSQTMSGRSGARAA
jgi:asparagine synthase (glutamine-hydrolysing)